jgi:methylmalonyl-CoA/ethylmalonyl-CoA epimerase
MKENSPFLRLDHVGIIVNDLDEVIKHFESLGIGPCIRPGKFVRLNRKIRGKEIDMSAIKNRSALFQIGPVMFEMIEPGEGDPDLSLWKRDLDKRGEGLHHLAFTVDSVEELKEAKAAMEKQGLEVVSESDFEGGGHVYFDTSKVGGILFELIKWAPGVLPEADWTAQ